MLPPEWRAVLLGEICDFKYGKNLPGSKREIGEVPVFGSNGIVGYHSQPLTAGPAIIIGRKGSLGEVHLSHEACWPIDTTYYVDQNSTKADLRWLAYRLTGLDLKKLNRAAAVPGLNRDDAYRLPLLLPPLPEQRRIAAILDQAEQLRAKRQRALNEFDSLAQSIFLDMFGDPRNNPKGWPLLTLEEICDKINDCPHSTPVWTASGVMCLRTSNLMKGRWSWDDVRYVSETTYHERSKRAYLKSGDIVVSREGTVGVAAIFPRDVKACMGQRLVQIRTSEDRLEPSYLLQHLLHILEPQRIASSMVGSTSHHLNVGALRVIEVPIPPLKLQSAFRRHTEECDQLRRALIDSLTNIDDLFASLQHRAFRGEL